MPRKENMAVREGNDPIPQNSCVMVRGITLEDFRRVMSKVWDRKMDDKLTEDLRRTDQRSARLSRKLRSHFSPWRQMSPQTPRLASARKAPLRQYKRCMGVAVLPTGLIPFRCILPASVMTAPDLRHSLVQWRNVTIL